MRKRKGVLTLEAALVVPIFVFLIFFMTQLMKVVYIYDTVQANIYNTARFVNGYTYLAEATGLNDYSVVKVEIINLKDLVLKENIIK